MSVDAVWVVGGKPDAPDRDELRYSLRSVEVNLGITFRDVWIVGDVPNWFTGRGLRTTADPDKWFNQRRSIEAYVNHRDAADEFVLFNDDHYVIEAVAEVEPFRYEKPASEWSADHGAHGWSCWRCGVKKCLAWVSSELGRDVWVYECHTPLAFSTAKMRDVLTRYPADMPFMSCSVFPAAGVGGEGRYAGNAKAGKGSVLADKLALDMPFISGNPDSWPGGLGDHVKALFPEPCRWEA